MRMTHAVRRILVDLLSDPAAPHYGLQIAKRAGVGSGTLYPALARMEDHGWVTGEWEQIDESAEGRPARRYYRLTAAGREVAETARDELYALYRLLPGRPA